MSRAKHELILRGNESSEYRQCELCGRHVYWPMGEMYALASSLVDQKPMCQAHTGYVFTEEVYQRWSQFKLKGAGIGKLLIRETPRDGLDKLVI